MKITDVKTFVIHPPSGKNLCFVKVETDEGIHGWGEAYTHADRAKTIESHIHQLARYLRGRSPFEIKHFTFWAYTDFADKRGAMDLYCAISGIEIALWDIVGKAAGQPVHNLLGGPCREKIRVYANGWGGGGDVDTLARRAEEVIELGFTALKFDPFPGPRRAYIDRAQEDIAVERVKAVREAVGPDVEILVEVHRRLAPMHAVRVARRIEAYRPFWYEEPVSSRDLNGLAEARSQINIPVVSGEELYLKQEFVLAFEKHVADIINPDIGACGGILELKEIGAMAEAYHVAVAPHNYNSTTVGLAATMQAVATMPNFIILEYFVNLEPLGRDIAMTPFEVVDSHIALPDQPGLGIELDEDALARYPYEPFPARRIRYPGDEM